MIVKINKWHEDSLYTFYIKEDVLKEIKDDSVYNLMVGSESALIDGMSTSYVQQLLKAY